FAGKSTAMDGDAQRTGDPDESLYPRLDEWPESERLSREKKSLGFYLTGHPLLRWESLVKKYATHDLSDVAQLADGTAVLVGVQVTKLTKKVSKRTGEPFWIATVEDLKGSLEIFVTKELHEASKDSLQEESLLFLKGNVRWRDTTASLRLESIIPFDVAPAKLTEDLSLVIPVENSAEAEDLIFRLKAILQGHRGQCPVYLVFRNSAGERAVLLVGSENYVSADAQLLATMDDLCGSDRVLVNRMGKRRNWI
ncbi:MAG TPA: OB-fold nucleic acid binding domain-containing protein, partial [Planctomycetota bacterium]|nr:OB-fold nucleic acid binding domain-containing protein [Planctomycetota bacterium]